MYSAAGYCDFATPAFSMMPPQRSISAARNFCSAGGGGLATGRQSEPDHQRLHVRRRGRRRQLGL